LFTTNQLAATYSLPGEQTFLAISPDSLTLYASEIANTGNGVQVITAATGALTDLIPFPFPTGLTVTPDGTQLWVCNSTNDPTTGGIYAVNTSTNTVSGGPILLTNTAPSSVLFSPGGTNAYAIYAQIPPNLTSYLVQIDVSSETIVNSSVADKPLRRD
jgi:DNA-binding beta-propeller fold protein YncE